MAGFFCFTCGGTKILGSILRGGSGPAGRSQRGAGRRSRRHFPGNMSGPPGRGPRCGTRPRSRSVDGSFPCICVPNTSAGLQTGGPPGVFFLGGTQSESLPGRPVFADDLDLDLVEDLVPLGLPRDLVCGFFWRAKRRFCFLGGIVFLVFRSFDLLFFFRVVRYVSDPGRCRRRVQSGEELADTMTNSVRRSFFS